MPARVRAAAKLVTTDARARIPAKAKAAAQPKAAIKTAARADDT